MAGCKALRFERLEIDRLHFLVAKLYPQQNTAPRPALVFLIEPNTLALATVSVENLCYSVF